MQPIISKVSDRDLSPVKSKQQIINDLKQNGLSAVLVAKQIFFVEIIRYLRSLSDSVVQSDQLLRELSGVDQWNCVSYEFLPSDTTESDSEGLDPLSDCRAIRSVATGNQWGEPMKSFQDRFHWSTRLISSISWWVRWLRTWIVAFTGRTAAIEVYGGHSGVMSGNRGARIYLCGFGTSEGFLTTTWNTDSASSDVGGHWRGFQYHKLCSDPFTKPNPGKD